MLRGNPSIPSLPKPATCSKLARTAETCMLARFLPAPCLQDHVAAIHLKQPSALRFRSAAIYKAPDAKHEMASVQTRLSAMACCAMEFKRFSWMHTT